MAETQSIVDGATLGLLRQGAARAVNCAIQASGKPLLHETYDVLTTYAFGTSVVGEVSDAFRTALRRDPLCHAPFGEDRIIIGDIDGDPDALNYPRMLARSLSKLWPEGRSALMGQDEATQTLRFAHDATGNNVFKLPRLGAFFRRIRERNASSYCAVLQSGDVINLRHFNVGKAQLEAARCTAMIPDLLAAVRDPENDDAPIDPVVFVGATGLRLGNDHITQLLNAALSLGVRFAGGTN